MQMRISINYIAIRACIYNDTYDYYQLFYAELNNDNNT